LVVANFEGRRNKAKKQRCFRGMAFIPPVSIFKK